MLILAIGIACWVQYRAHGARLDAGRAQQGIRAGRARDRRVIRLRDHAAPRAAQRDRAGAGDRHASTSALAIITEATLSFLGVGVPPTQPSLGTLIRIGNDFLFSGEWWITIFPGVALVCWCCRSTCWATGCATRSTRGCADGRCPHCSKSAICASSSRRGAARCVRSTTSPSTSRRARCSAWSANPAPASRSPAPPSSACSSRPAASPAGRSCSTGERIDNLPPRADAPHPRPAIGAIFQDPLTTLNPLYTVGRQLDRDDPDAPAAEPTPRRARRAIGWLRRGRHPGRGAAHRPLSARVLRRHAPARGDRAGALRRAEADHRRRADHRARRLDPGADHRAAEAPVRASTAPR